MTTSQLAVRLDEGLLAAIDRLIPGMHASRSELIRRAIELYVYRIECEREAEIYREQPLSDVEMSIGDDLRNWESAPTW